MAGIRRPVFAALAAFVVLLAAAPVASARERGWNITTLAPTEVEAGKAFSFQAQVENLGSTEYSGTEPGHPIVISGELPAGLEVLSLEPFNEFGPWVSGCTTTVHTFTCTTEATFPAFNATGTGVMLRIEAWVEPGASGALTSTFEVHGGALSEPSDTTTDTVKVSSEPSSFGVESFDVENAGESPGSSFTQAGGHPTVNASSLVFNIITYKPGFIEGGNGPAEPPRDVRAQLPPGFLGNPSVAPKCSLEQLSNANSLFTRPECPTDSQVGTITLGYSIIPQPAGAITPPLPVFNMEPPPGVAARLGFALLGVTGVIDAKVRNGGDYGIDLVSSNLSEGLALPSRSLEIWGVPASHDHDLERACQGLPAPLGTAPGVPDAVGPHCPPDEATEAAFLRLPTSCADEAAGMPFTVAVDSWFHPAVFAAAVVRTHEGPGFPVPNEPSTFPAGYSGPTEWGPPEGPSGCVDVPFEPTISVQPTSERADSPTGLEIDLELPQENLLDPKAISTSDLENAVVTLPKGMTVNPSSATGLEACTPAQIGLTTPVGDENAEFNSQPSCPDGSKIGSVEIETPLLEEDVTGAVYLAQQGRNPFGSMLAMYIVAKANGVVLTLPGKIEAQGNGQLVTTFSHQPQQPFSHLHLNFYGGPRAALRTPSACGSYATEAKLSPWSGNAPVDLSSSFQISQGCGGGFDPKLKAGTENPVAGEVSPFHFRLSREDGSQELGGLSLTMPPGLSGYLKGISYCSDAALVAVSTAPGTGAGQIASPSCPASSRVGTVTAGAGAGVNPFYSTSGRVYLAGPYKGAPISLAVVTPAVAGPFDLGSVVVRNAVHVVPSTAQLTAVSDPLPTILHGIPLDLREVRVNIDRPHFTVNPTSCEEMSIDSTIVSAQGATAHPSQRFQVAGCERLGFKPRLSISLFAPTHRAAHPALRAILRARPGDANIGAGTVLLPKTELLENAHIRTICTRVQYDAGPGAGAECPKGSIYGYAKAWSPLLEQPLQGPVYLRANGGKRELPDLVASINGQIHVDLVGFIDSVHARIRNRFAVVPDAPVSKFELRMQGGKKGLLANNTELCRAKPKFDARFDGHNGKSADFTRPVKVRCGGKAQGKR